MVGLALDYLVPIYLFSFTFMASLIANSALASQGDFATLGIVQVIAFVLNCIFDPLFMFGWGPIPGFGIMGLAVATVSINLIGVLFISTEPPIVAFSKILNGPNWAFSGAAWPIWSANVCLHAEHGRDRRGLHRYRRNT